MLDISNAVHVLSLGVLTVWSLGWNPKKPTQGQSVVHSLALNNDIIYEGTGFDIIYVQIWLFMTWSAK
jgi:hypothetical protein